MPDRFKMSVVRTKKHYPRPEGYDELNRQRVRRWRAELTCEERRERSNTSRQRLRSRLMMLLGGCCEVCGINDGRVLQFDHVNGGGVAERRSLRAQETMYRRMMRNPQNFQILCANHNWIKRFDLQEQNWHKRNHE